MNMTDDQAADKVGQIIASTIDQFSEIVSEVEAGVEINAEFVVNGKKYIFTIHEEDQNNYLHQN